MHISNGAHPGVEGYDILAHLVLAGDWRDRLGTKAS